MDANNSNVIKKVRWMKTFLDLDKFWVGDKVSVENIATYYKLTDIPYQKYYSQDGFMHFHVSTDGEYHPEDAYYQPKTVSRFIKPGDKVLELGFGKGPNIFFLAEKHPDAEFTGIDLNRLHRENTFSNVKLYYQDYSDLSNFADNTFTVVYGFETLCYFENKDKVFSEVYRVMKPGGHFIVYDYAIPEPFETYDPDAQVAVACFTKVGAAGLSNTVEEWENAFIRNGFKRESITDLSRNLLPDMKRMEKVALRIMDSKIKAKMAFATMPDYLVGMLIPGYTSYDLYNEGYMNYKEWIFTK